MLILKQWRYALRTLALVLWTLVFCGCVGALNAAHAHTAVSGKASEGAR
jgi:hypothetical protein